MQAIEQIGINGAYGRYRKTTGLEVLNVAYDDPKANLYKMLIWAAATLGGVSVALQTFVLNEMYQLHSQLQVVDARTASEPQRLHDLSLEMGRIRADVARLQAQVEVRK